jgi:3-hydroxyacyl-CoA dehydrogenase
MSTTSQVATSISSFTAKSLLVRRAAALGAGTMGSRIAAHLANAGIPTLPLDVVSAERKTQERIAFTLRTGKPQ